MRCRPERVGQYRGGERGACDEQPNQYSAEQFPNHGVHRPEPGGLRLILTHGALARSEPPDRRIVVSEIIVVLPRLRIVMLAREPEVEREHRGAGVVVVDDAVVLLDGLGDPGVTDANDHPSIATFAQ